MRKILALVVLLSLLLLVPSCNSGTGDGSGMQTIINSAEYILYQNIFYNKTGDQYVGQTMTKTGIFTIIHDSYSSKDRYYVWGYSDQTKCCDWQWEFIPSSVSDLPPIGSYIDMIGVFEKNDGALDKYWFANASVKIKNAYAGETLYDIDMTTMSDTLERVQLINMTYRPEEYEGKRVRAYGRIASLTSIQDPYYNGRWTQRFATTGTIPAVGTMVILDGIFRGGIIDECTVTPTNAY